MSLTGSFRYTHRQYHIIHLKIPLHTYSRHPEHTHQPTNACITTHIDTHTHTPPTYTYVNVSQPSLACAPPGVHIDPQTHFYAQYLLAQEAESVHKNIRHLNTFSLSNL